MIVLGGMMEVGVGGADYGTLVGEIAKFSTANKITISGIFLV